MEGDGSVAFGAIKGRYGDQAFIVKRDDGGPDAHVPLAFAQDVGAIHGAKPIPLTPKPAIVASFEDKENGVTADVAKRDDGRFAVTVRDNDTGERVGSIIIVDAEADAIARAKEIAAGKAPQKETETPKKPPVISGREDLDSERDRWEAGDRVSARDYRSESGVVGTVVGKSADGKTIVKWDEGARDKFGARVRQTMQAGTAGPTRAAQ
jgi:hypothetical protein